MAKKGIRQMAKMAYNLAHYLEVDGTYELLNTFTAINESPAAQTEETQYTTMKAKAVDTVGYQGVWALEGDLNGTEKAVTYLEDIGKEQKLGDDATTKLAIVELDNPADVENEFYAREVLVAVEITDLPNEGGAKRKISGNLNQLKDIVIGSFNTTTKTFSAK